MKRRRFLTSGSAVVGGLLAGCIAEGNRQPSDPETPTDDSPRSGGDAQPSVQDNRIETVDTGCMSEDVTGIDVSVGETAVEVDGIAQVSNPCHEARIDSASVSNGELRVVVGFDRDDGPCADCVGQLQYEATVELDTTDGIDTVTVVHDNNAGRQFTEKPGGDGPAASPSDGGGTTPVDDPESVPDPDLQVSIDNEHDERHEIEVEIARESGEDVYAETHAIDAGSERAIYNLREASPDGVETFEITATMDGATETIRVETSECYGAAIVSVTDDGTLYPFYSIC